MENNTEKKIICDIYNPENLNPDFFCRYCPFNYVSGRPGDVCPMASSLDEAIEILNDVSAKARKWADEFARKKSL